MKKILAPVFAIILMVACSKEKKNLHITGNIDGLKKGTLYLQKIDSSAFVIVDSMVVDGDANFDFNIFIESPQMIYLALEKEDGIKNNDLLEIFAEPGEMTVNTTRNYFIAEAKIEGSESHRRYKEYRDMISKFNDRNLNYLKESVEASKKGDSATFDSLQNESDKNAKRRYLYTLNFILNNKDSYLAPYLALTETYNARLKYLDSINNSLTEEVAKSKYGKELDEYIKTIREQNKENDSIQE
ncbi:protein of unknown function [Zhouia amylolytica]|uniref:DUF4369 domain-containing protein n=2 Tax=Zhouia amylolytica TaxID=376730 RepID=W2USH8_9FLAO|nr:DUF4369 domain-containing protein [Zhouia amylolytica]ETN96958.1 hypothetical protein P278_03840 [Zhouia amylolytica AD3]MCQ0110195.1 DUF4369 domain-containing protein [Zhouia amylolytica]SFS92439.1 protein of unknown function [Zhouia amylolytica]